jgi:hypothetical protein
VETVPVSAESLLDFGNCIIFSLMESLGLQLSEESHRFTAEIVKPLSYREGMAKMMEQFE